MKFSQRIGITPVKSILQIGAIDSELRNRLWNTILDEYFDKVDNTSLGENSNLEICYRQIWKEFFNYEVDKIPSFHSGGVIRILVYEVRNKIKEWFFNSPWYEVYDFIEYLCELDKTLLVNALFERKCNDTLKRELSGYRVINGKIVQITSEEEISEIEEAIDKTSNWKSVNTHLTSALNLLADKNSTNYRNSIKESISAVESLCVIITKDEKATLGKALGIIEKKYALHKALKESFSALYGYTSDASGIRHSLIENDVSVDFEEAKFMLVSCSAFVNFLKAKFTI